MDVGLVLELLGEVLEALEAHELGQQPLLEALLGAEEAVPGALDVRDHLALRRHVRRPVRQAQLRLQLQSHSFGIRRELSTVPSSILFVKWDEITRFSQRADTAFCCKNTTS